MMNIKILVFSALGVLVSILLFLWLLTRIRYRIGSRHVKVLLFGLCIRRIALTSIEGVSKRRGEGWAEHWSSTLHPKHRTLVIRRSRGLCKNFIITPKNRYIFKTDLERALQRSGVRLPQSQPETSEPETEPAQDEP
jgi:hypothetical protein